MKAFISILLAVFITIQGLAQQPPAVRAGNLVRKFITAQKDTVQVDSLSLVPGSFSILGVDSRTYILNAPKGVLVWKQRPAADSVLAVYRVFPYRLHSVVQELSFDSVRNNFLAPFVFRTGAPAQGKLFDFGNIDYTGSFGRGISFGNSQDAVLNSNLNLQLNGMLADSIELSAAISDQNLPVQPDGSTSQLNEIDRIWIEFKKKNWKLNLGDIDLRQNHQYYLNFYKRLQGLAFESSQRLSKNIQNSFLVTGAIARGKFTANQFQAQEGNQGPYRLQGANNEFFFIILANSERVFIDGELMQRGEDQDYTINYNTAEITFTPRRLITKDKRIRIEFEYSDRNYLNSQLYATNHTRLGEKFSVRISAFSNADARNSPINQVLNTQQQQFMAGIGDSVQNAYYPNIVKDTLTPGKILYQRKDTTFSSITRTIYVYSTNPDSAKYNLSFAELGPGRGDYIPLFNGANGKVFKWVQPVGGIKQGSYEPVLYLVAPRKQQVVSLLAAYQLNPAQNLSAELAMSRNDINTFSKIDKGNDQGLAARLQWKLKQPPTAGPPPKRILESELSYEVNNRNFRTVERLRTPEFNRDWNLPLIAAFSSEQLGSAALEWRDAKRNFLQLQAKNYFRDSAYRGFRQGLQSQLDWKGWVWTTQLSVTSTNSQTQKGLFVRPTTEISKVLKKMRNYRIGFQFFAENNQLLNKTPDSLDYLSIGFESWKYYLNSREDKPNKWSLGYIARNNRIPVGKNLELSDVSQDISFTTELEANPRRRFKLNAVYRNLDVKLPQRVSFKSDQTILGRAEYNFSEWKGLLSGNILYEAGSGQEQQRDITYLEVPAGQGEYYWIDYNANGSQELNEFELAQFPDQRRFIRIFVPTNRFIKANFTTFNYGLNINPRAVLNKGGLKGWKNMLSRVYLQSGWQVTKKEQSAGGLLISPFKTGTADASLITLGNIFSNSFSFNKFSTVWGVDINQVLNANKALLTYGYESRRLQSWTLKSRWNLNKKFLFELIGKTGRNSLLTPGFNNRNYEIDLNGGEARAAYTWRSNFRMTVSYQYDRRINRPQWGGENAIIHSLGTEVKYNALQSASINGKFTFSNINYTGATNSTVSFIMLDALLPGKNYLWNIDLIKTLNNNLELTFRYEGRKTGISRVVHIGGATLRATFF